jgi:hypothetical protein
MMVLIATKAIIKVLLFVDFRRFLQVVKLVD